MNSAQLRGEQFVKMATKDMLVAWFLDYPTGQVALVLLGEELLDQDRAKQRHAQTLHQGA